MEQNYLIGCYIDRWVCYTLYKETGKRLCKVAFKFSLNNNIYCLHEIILIKFKEVHIVINNSA